MSKTSFSKSQLFNLYRILLGNKMLPCKKISVQIDPFNINGITTHTIMRFVKGKKALRYSFSYKNSA